MRFRGHVLLERAVANVCGQARRAQLRSTQRLQAPAWPKGFDAGAVAC